MILPPCCKDRIGLIHWSAISKVFFLFFFKQNLPWKYNNLKTIRRRTYSSPLVFVIWLSSWVAWGVNTHIDVWEIFVSCTQGQQWSVIYVRRKQSFSLWIGVQFLNRIGFYNKIHVHSTHNPVFSSITKSNLHRIFLNSLSHLKRGSSSFFHVCYLRALSWAVWTFGGRALKSQKLTCKVRPEKPQKVVLNIKVKPFS